MNRQETIKFLRKYNIPFQEEENNMLGIKRCEICNNGYQYGEEPTPINPKQKFRDLLDNPWIFIIDCDLCCGCGDW